MHRYEVAFPIVGIGYYYLDSEEKLSDSEAVAQAYWEITENAEQLDDYNWEVFDASPFAEAQVIEEWSDDESR